MDNVIKQSNRKEIFIAFRNYNKRKYQPRLSQYMMTCVYCDNKWQSTVEILLKSRIIVKRLRLQKWANVRLRLQEFAIMWFRLQEWAIMRLIRLQEFAIMRLWLQLRPPLHLLAYAVQNLIKVGIQFFGSGFRLKKYIPSDSLRLRLSKTGYVHDMSRIYVHCTVHGVCLNKTLQENMKISCFANVQFALIHVISSILVNEHSCQVFFC
jgi:hypothetical protein